MSTFSIATSAHAQTKGIFACEETLEFQYLGNNRGLACSDATIAIENCTLATGALATSLTA